MTSCRNPLWRSLFGLKRTQVLHCRMSADDPKRTCQQPHLAAGKEMPSQRGDWLGVLSGRVWGRGPREKSIRHYEDKNLFVVI
jgi:hypothetical protein